MAWQSKIDKSNIHPGLVAVMDRAFGILDRDGNPFKAYSGLRTFTEQNELYDKGRTADGSIVTNAKGGQSMHNYGLALDSAPLVDKDNDQGNVHWPKLGTVKGEVWLLLEHAVADATRFVDEEIDDGIDYEWGGRWKFIDVPHVQVRTTLKELQAGEYPHCTDLDWLVKAHTTFLFNTPWMKRRVQLLLNLQSYNCGAVDGIIGSNTVESLSLFQKDQGLSVEHHGITVTQDPAVGNWTLDKQTIERLVRLHQTGMSLPRGTLPKDLLA